MITKKENQLGPWMLVPCAPDVCQECAVKHEPDAPHNAQSMYYQYKFYGRWGRWPTWADAILHCPEQIRKLTIDVLRENGIEITEEQLAKSKETQ